MMFNDDYVSFRIHCCLALQVRTAVQGSKTAICRVVLSLRHCLTVIDLLTERERERERERDSATY